MPKISPVKRLILFLVCTMASFLGSSQTNYTPTYDELLAEYRELSERFPEVCQLDSFGLTDRGLPLHAFLINSKGVFQGDSIQDEVVLLILNGIHPGEPCGINASLEFAREVVKSPDSNLTFCIIPAYNIGGMMNRGSYSRANQLGPEAYGFRGNARNLDLNRDFIKADSRNTKAFYRLFQEFKPHILIDTHTSNGADYQPTLTLLSTFPENLESPVGDYLRKTMEPALYRAMKEKNQEVVPYVNVFGTTPDSGYKAFTDHPRYSTGYASLFNTIGFTTEAHMLKPFNDRVMATRQFLETITEYAASNHREIIDLKINADSLTKSREVALYNWKITEKADSIDFPGFKASKEKTSKVTGQKTLRYDRSAPYRKRIPYYAYHEAESEYQIPEYYILSGAWTEVIELLNLNKVVYEELDNDTTLEVEAIYISEYETIDRPYEGHFKHSDIATEYKREKIDFFSGDLIIPTNQAAKKYLAHVFNPKAADSFFSWNFFDSCLMQKEYFSSYVFDETATEILNSNEDLKREFEEKRKSDPDFASNSRQQLDFIYKHSLYYEKTHRRLPVFEIR